MSKPDNATPLSPVLDTLSQGVFWKDCDSVYLGCNTVFAKAVGLNHPSEILGKTDADLSCTPAEVESHRADDLEVIKTGRRKQFVLESIRPSDGELFWVETTKAPLRDEAGCIVGVVGLFTDVTAYYRQSIDLRQAQHMLQSVLDTIPARVFWKDRDGVYLGCNRLFANDAGLESPDQLIGRTDHMMGWADQAELYRADDAAVVSSGQPKIGYEEPQTTPDGKQIWLRTSKIPLQEPNGEIIGVLGTYEDITGTKTAEAEQRRLEAQVQHAQKLKSLGILAGGIAHDFNNLLVAVLGNADLALMQLPQSVSGYQNVQEIKTAAMRARELTNQMLAYSGKGRFVVRSLQLGDVVREMGQLLEAAIPKKVSLRYDLAAKLPPVEVDAAQIRQVVMNLVTNAAEAMGDQGGRITLASGQQLADEAYLKTSYLHQDLPAGDYVFIEVSDDGCGMDPDTRERLFEPFFTTKFQGRGLGLAAVLGIVNGHRGTIKVHSEPGHGSSLKVLLPVGDGTAPQPAPVLQGETDPPAPLGGTVLVVDDEEHVLNVADAMLRTFGLGVLTAADGAAALDVYRENRDKIDVVLLDMTMPRLDGAETFRQLRTLNPNLKVILTSGYNEQDATSSFVGKGLAGFIQKPFMLRDLEAMLRRTLGGGGAKRP
jgi:two-component system cell cycle sensor histidine kinase/response regulator CckA